jgi:hypothetical protein
VENNVSRHPSTVKANYSLNNKCMLTNQSTNQPTKPNQTKTNQPTNQPTVTQLVKKFPAF